MAVYLSHISCAALLFPSLRWQTAGDLYGCFPQHLPYIGLRRRGFSNETIQNIHEAYRLLYSKGILKEGIEEIKKNLEVTKEIQYIIDFVESSQRGIIR